MKISKRKLTTLAVTVAATGGLLMATPAAHAAQVTPAYGACDYYNNDLEVDYTSGWQCDPSHSNHRDPINRCDVLEIDSGSNWVAAWVGPTLSNLHYVSGGPNTSFENDGYTFCVGDIAVNP